MTGDLETYRRRLNDVAEKIAGQVDGPPVDMQQLCEWFGVVVKGVDGSEKDRFRAGLAFENGILDRPTVLISRYVYGTAYSRVCIAHEIAHLILIREYGAVPKSRAEYWKYEVVCDEFARRILVPTSYVERLLREKPSREGRILIRSIDIEHDAAITWIHGARRLAELSNVDFLRVQQRPSGAFFVASTTLRKGRSAAIEAKTPLGLAFGDMLAAARDSGRARLTEVSEAFMSQLGDKFAVPEACQKVFAICRRRAGHAFPEVLLTIV